MSPEKTKVRWDWVAVAVALLLSAGNIIAVNWPSYPKKAVWQEKKVGVTYRATSDGFVVLSTFGSTGIRGATVSEGPSEEDLEPRARVQGYSENMNHKGYDSATLPIRKGRYWKVEPFGRGDTLPKVLWTDT